MYISDTKVYYERLIEHELSILEYCVADFIEKIAGSGRAGFFFMRKEKIAEAFGIGLATVYRIIKKLESKDIIKKDGELISMKTWKGNGNFFYIRHKLREELKKEMKIVLSMEEYAIVDITINQPRVKACEVQRRINCSKNSTNTYMKNISSQKGFRFKKGKIEIRDICIKGYFISKFQEENEEEQEKIAEN